MSISRNITQNGFITNGVQTFMPKNLSKFSKSKPLISCIMSVQCTRDGGVQYKGDVQ